ncbi:MAG: hypothetical protein DMF08_06490 [Verrucomicrobia bacterium]|nr:MAG: hypothetical protein DMF08_06490 [Verrucomicrobiota bacterium]
MSAPDSRSLAGIADKFSRSVQRIALTKAASPFSLQFWGETDAPAPVRAKEWARERARVRVLQRVVPSGGLTPLTLVLSPWPRGEAKKQHGPTTTEHCHIGLKSYSKPCRRRAIIKLLTELFRYENA